MIRKLLLCVFTLFWGVVCTQTIHAHELRPAYLSVTETQEGQYEILWKTPALGEKQLALKANFPEHCTATNGVRRIQQSQFAIETWTLNCPQSLRGQTLTIGGLEKTLTDVLVRTAWLGGDTFTDRLTPNRPTHEFANTQTRGGIAATYFMLGVQHILGGIDHLLFVLAVMLLITRGKKLFFAITAFTIGHSITLALASLDLVRLNPTLVEVLIALSIALMAYEAVRHRRNISGLTTQFPWVVTFCFGLLHGFGFAGALRAIGLPQTDLPAALLFFNIGVEAGQLIFIACVTLLMIAPFIKSITTTRTFAITASYAIGTLAVFWTLQRAMPVFLTG